MRKIFFMTAVLFMGAMSSIAQTVSDTNEVDYYQSLFGMAKKTLVSEFVDLTDYPADQFWALYDAYEAERKELGKSRLELLENYAKNYQTLDEVKTNELIKQMDAQKKNLDKLIFKYYKKMSSAVGAKPAAQFYQMENYLLSAIRLAILESIPFIGEL
jgi:Spy/CpxP family protein refolding chaperone